MKRVKGQRYLYDRDGSFYFRRSTLPWGDLAAKVDAITPLPGTTRPAHRRDQTNAKKPKRGRFRDFCNPLHPPTAGQLVLPFAVLKFLKSGIGQ